jgi:hypothetical protein
MASEWLVSHDESSVWMSDSNCQQFYVSLDVQPVRGEPQVNWFESVLLYSELIQTESLRKRVSPVGYVVRCTNDSSRA